MADRQAPETGPLPASSGVSYHPVRATKPADLSNCSTDSTSSNEAIRDRALPVPGVVDLHKRAHYLQEQGSSRYQAYQQAVREIQRYQVPARCDGCGVLRTELHSEQDHAGQYQVVCSFCLM
jgi:hypothetical protein